MNYIHIKFQASQSYMVRFQLKQKGGSDIIPQSRPCLTGCEHGKGSTLHIHVQDLLQILIPSHVYNSKLSGNTESRHRIPIPLINSSKKCALYLDTKHGLREDQDEALLHRGRIQDTERGRRTNLAPIASEDSEGLKNPQLHTHLSVALAH